VQGHRNPLPTVDVIIEVAGGIVLIQRRFPPAGWALPGGFVDYGEDVETAAVREAKEETGLDVTLTDLLWVYSDPQRDPRQHTISVVFLGRAEGTPTGGDDAAAARTFPLDALPGPLAFDHGRILADYLAFKRDGRRPTPAPRLIPLTPAERRLLLQIARQSIRAELLGEAAPTPAGLTSPLETAGTAFVSLHQGGELRGCIGSLTADAPLHATVARVARSAAVEDPRFPPLTVSEVSGLDIEISRLSALVPVPPEAVVPGLHGVSIACQGRRAVFLPQVATKYGWDRETLLRELCQKAHLAPDAWRSPEAHVSVFVAEVFSDADAAGPPS